MYSFEIHRDTYPAIKEWLEILGEYDDAYLKQNIAGFKSRRIQQQAQTLSKSGTSIDQENILANDQVVAFQHILIERVPPVALDIRIVIHRRMVFTVAIPSWKAAAPAVLHGNKMGIILVIPRQHAGAAGEA